MILALVKAMNDLSSSLQAYQAFKSHLNIYAEEVWVLALDAQLNLIKKSMIFRGTADSCLIHPRDIMRELILCNACSFILGHNHPSNQTLPSESDLRFTKCIYDVGHLMQIPLLDHIIFTQNAYYSMADYGHFKKWKKRKTTGAVY